MAEMTVTEFASMGGKARALKLTKARRVAIARKAVAAREARRAEKRKSEAKKASK